MTGTGEQEDFDEQPKVLRVYSRPGASPSRQSDLSWAARPD